MVAAQIVPLFLLSLCIGQSVSHGSELDEFISAGMKDSKVPGLAAVVVKGDSVVWSGYYGMADLEKRKPVTAETLFQIASVSKTITGCVVMQQVERGHVELDTDVNEVLPFSVRNPRHPNAPITLRQLLTHTSGVCDNWDVLERTWVTNKDFPETLESSLGAYFTPGGKYYESGKNFCRCAPGARTEYSNVGTALVALIAEKSGGIPFETQCEEFLFAPLQIKGSSFRLEKVDRSRLAVPYEYRKNQGGYKSPGHHGYLDFPAGSLRITAKDLSVFLRMFMADGEFNGTRIIKEGTVEEMMKIQFPKLDADQGLIWYREQFGKRRLIGHNGGDPGVASMMYFDPKSKAGFLVLMNAEPKNASFETNLARKLLSLTESH